MTAPAWYPRLVPALIVFLLACRSEGTPDRTATTDAPAAVRNPAESPAWIPDADLALPARWAGRVRRDSLSTAERGNARPGAVEFSYLPRDPATHPEVLVAIAVYDAPAWAAVRADSGPPPGDSVAALGGKIFVVAPPQSNPFAAGTPDAASFDSLQLSKTELKGFVQPREK